MRKFLGVAACAAAALLGQSATAATLLSSTAGSGTTLTAVTLTGTEDLRNNATPYASGSFLIFPPYDAYLFNEGTDDDGVQSFLLHYDRKGGLTSVGNVSGVFVLQLGLGETYLGAIDKAPGLLASDPTNGVRYQTSVANAAQITATLFRGTEYPDGYAATYNAGLRQLTVAYNLTNDGVAQDQVRFRFQQAAIAAPEPASWALMIGGFGLAGASLRRRRQAAA